MLVQVDYSYTVEEYGSDTFDVDDPKDEALLKGLIEDELGLSFGPEAFITNIEIEEVKEFKNNV